MTRPWQFPALGSTPQFGASRVLGTAARRGRAPGWLRCRHGAGGQPAAGQAVETAAAQRFGGGPTDSQAGFPSWEHNSFTFEGEIERLGAIGRNMSNAPRWARLTAKFVVLSMLAVVAVGVIQFLVHVVG